MRLKNSTVKIVIIAFIFCIVFKFPIYAQLENIPLITVIGESVVKVKPDYVIMGLKVKRGIKKDYKEDFCSTFEIFCKDETNIKLFDFDEKNMDESVIQIENSIYFKEIFVYIMDLNKLEKYILQLYKLGYNDYIYLDYRVKNINEYKNLSKKDALNSAKVKATLLADELYQKIGKAHLIEEMDCEAYNWYNIRKVENVENITFKQGFDNYLVEPGYITLTSKIKVSFDLQK